MAIFKIEGFWGLFKVENKGELQETFGRMRNGIMILAVISAFLNILLLGGSIYMLLIYDSVLPSQSVPTLLALLTMVLVVYIFQAVFEIFRSRILADMANGLTASISPRIQDAINFMALRRTVQKEGDGLAPMRDLDNIRQFLSGPGPGAFLDLPWVIFFLGVLTLLHPWLGFSALFGAIVLLALTLTMARISKEPATTLSRLSGRRYNMADVMRRHAEIIFAYGIERRLAKNLDQLNEKVVEAQDRLTESNSAYTGVSKVFRMFLQSFVLTVGALLVIRGEASGGVIFAASILAARALAPIDQVTSQWKAFAAAKLGWERLELTLKSIPISEECTVQLAPPATSLSVEELFLGPPGANETILEGVSLKLDAGDVLGVIGLSAAGKSTLIKALIGIWQPMRGKIRLDGAELSQWSRNDLGQHIGYLPQTVELLPGTVAENIARFSTPIDSEKVLMAAKAADVHNLIVQLPEGYETLVGADGRQLSAGQQQRIALARALYGDPFLVVLDEPNSNLDALGEVALDHAIRSIHKRRGIVVVVAHRRSAIARASHILMLRNGRVEAFGPRDDILGSFPHPVANAGKSDGFVAATSIRPGKA